MDEKCIVGRFVNGISLNGYEFVLNDEEEIKVFDDKSSAVEFLKENGLAEEDIENLAFLNYERYKEGKIEDVA